MRARFHPWITVALLAFVSLLNYFDRQSLSVVAPRVQLQLHLSDQGYAHIVSIFLFASAVSFLFSGFLADALGTRRSMTAFVAVWSIAEAATGYVHAAWQLGVARFFLGVGEPGLWVAAPKAVAESLPKKHHGLAVGIYTAGATVGAIVAVPLVIAIERRFGWPAVFFASGVAGLLWLPVWLLFFREPRHDAAPVQVWQSLKTLVTHRAAWQLTIARALTDPVWFFYLFWYPKYLTSGRHLGPAELSRLGWIVYLFGGLGTILGGLLAGWWIRRGLPARQAYRRTMCLSVFLMPFGPLAYFAPGIAVSIACASIVGLAHMSWLINLTSTLMEVFPKDQLGKGAGMVAAGSALGGMVSSEIIGYFVTHGGYRPVFLLMAFMHPLAILILWSAFRTGNKLRRATPTASPATA